MLEREVLKAADLFRLEALLQHCVEAFRRGLKVDTAIEELVWAHLFGPAEARTVATEYFVRNFRRIRVGTVYNCVLFFQPFVFMYHLGQVLDRQGLGRRAQSVFSPLTPVLFSFQSSFLSMLSVMWAAMGTRDVAAAEAAAYRCVS
jgi:hypothetical protein